MHILITGAGSYVGTQVEKWIKNHSDYHVDTLDMMNDRWRKYDFSACDVIFHVAGIHDEVPASGGEIDREVAVTVAGPVDSVS